MEKYEHPRHRGYFADKLGNVYSKRGLLAGNVMVSGYRRHDIRGKSIRTNRFVWEAVSGELLSPLDIVNHLDLDKLNNAFSNLEKTTTAGNTQHYYNSTLVDTSVGDIGIHGNTGSNHPLSKLTEGRVRTLIGLLPHKTNEALAGMFDVNPSCVSLIRRKKRWKRVWYEMELERSETIPTGSTAVSD